MLHATPNTLFAAPCAVVMASLHKVQVPSCDHSLIP
jgi:hypothetical protein